LKDDTKKLNLYKNNLQSGAVSQHCRMIKMFNIQSDLFSSLGCENDVASRWLGGMVVVFYLLER
jgi:hypothetical protein